ncbi:MAG: transcription termination factor NusA [Thermoanaerobaculum sp.]
MKLTQLKGLIYQAAEEREITPERMVQALEDAIAQAARKHFKEKGVQAKVDLETGEISCIRVRQVVATPEEVKNPTEAITLEEAQKLDPNAKVGDTLVLGELDAEQLGRIAAQAARQMLFQRVREAERDNIHREYSQKIGEMVNGIVKRIERGDVIVDLGRTEGILPKREQIRSERFNQGERVRAVIVEVTKDANKPQVVLSRTSPMLLVRLLEMEVPEIFDGTVVIKGCVRAPGERAKVAVTSRDREVDPIGACVGMRGTRVQAIMRELKGEKVDIIPWSPDLVTFVQAALAPAKVNRVRVDEEVIEEPLRDTEGKIALDEEGKPLTLTKRRPVMEVVVSSEQYSMAIGKNGQNVKLADRLTGCKIIIKTEKEVKDEISSALAALLREVEGELAEEMTEKEEVLGAVEYDLLIPLEDVPGISERMRERLTEYGISHAQALAHTPAEKLMEIPGIGPHSAAKLIEAAKQALEAQVASRSEE